MIDLSATYLGIPIQSPIVVGSSGLCNSVDKIREFERNGAGAVVLKSIFEEEIFLEFKEEMKKLGEHDNNLEFLDYFDYQIRQENLEHYLQLVREAKKAVNMPVIASINCQSATEWIAYAREFEKAGADGLELNVFVLPSNMDATVESIESIYFNLANRVKKDVSIPVGLKVSSYFTNLANVMKRLSATGIAGLILFNRFYNPDFDLETQQVISSHVLSTPAEMANTLRWISILGGKLDCDLVASTGVHDGEGLIKMVMAGASSVEVVSAIYKEGPSVISQMLETLQKWMEKNNYRSLADFRGIMSQRKSQEANVFERVQFMRYFSSQDTL